MRNIATLLLIFSSFIVRAQILLQDLYQGPESSTPELEVLSAQTVLLAGTTGVYGRELWKTDGTCPNTVLVLDIKPGAGGSNPQYLTRIGNLVYFSADDGVHGPELWVTDGTATGTAMIKDIYTGSFGSEPENFMKAGIYVYFTAVDATHGREIWRTDGTVPGTQMVKDVQPGPTWGFGISDEMIVYKDSLFFNVFDYNYGESLWKTAGTLASTQLVRDFIAGSSGGGCFNLNVYNNLLFMAAKDATHGYELWRSDGSTAGTYLVKDINPGTGNAFGGSEDFQGYKGLLYFPADDGVYGEELWVTDGTTLGTQMVKDIRPGSTGSNIFDVDEYNDMLFFTANDGVHGQELWKSDGTADSTLLVKDIRPGIQSSMTSYPELTISGARLFFKAEDGSHGVELWQSDGTEGGTQMAIDLKPGSEGAGAAQLTDFNNTLMWVATTAGVGTEPYIYLPQPSEGPALIVQVDTVQSLSCYFSSDGKIEISVVQGVCPYLFYWSNGKTTEDLYDINSYQAGVYSVTVVDGAGHEVVVSGLEVQKPEWLDLTEVEYVRADCNGNPGRITLSGTGGWSPYSFVWDDGFTGPTRVNIPAGTTYWVTLTDSRGCTRDGLYGFSPIPPSGVYFGENNVNCITDTVYITQGISTLTSDKSAGTDSLTYHWTAENGGVILSSPDSLYILVVGPGTFHLTITDLVSGCTTVQTVEVGVDTVAPTASTGPDLLIPCSQSDFTLQASYNMNGSNGNPQYYWTAYDGGNFTNFWDAYELNSNADHSGTYVFTIVNEKNGCSDTDTTVVTSSNLSPPVSATGGTLNCVVTVLGLQVELGGDHTIFDEWTGPAGFTSQETNPIVAIPGLYTAFATDTLNGCSASAEVYVGQNLEMPYVDVYAYSDVLSCDQPTTTLVVYSVIIPSANDYLWTGPNNFSSSDSIVEVNQPGIYTMVVTQKMSGCTDVRQLEITGSSEITLDVVSLVSAGCPNTAAGSAEIEASGGDGDYTYLWSNGDQDALTENLLPGDYTATVSDGSGCSQEITVTISGTDTIAPQITCPAALVVGSCQSTVAFNLPGVADNCPFESQALVQTEGLPSGSQFPVGIVNNRFVYTDPGGHKDSCSFTVEVREAATLQLTGAPVSCHQGCDGALSLLISGDPPYTISWSTGADGLEVDSLCAGVYGVTVFDGYGCAYQTVATITEPEELVVAVDSVSDDLADQGIGAIYITAGGGTPPLDFLWTNLATGQTYTGEDLTGLSSAYYRCVITDANDCAFTTDSIFVNNLVGTTSADWVAGIELYPNPARQFVNLVYPAGSGELPDVSVYNITGQRVSVEITGKFPGQLLLDIGRLAPGVYPVWIRQDGLIAIRQLVVTGN